MITEGAVIGVLLNGHNLNGVIAIFLYSRQDVLGELLVSAHLLGILCHTHVALIDEQRVSMGLEVLLLEDIRLLGVPHLC